MSVKKFSFFHKKNIPHPGQAGVNIPKTIYYLWWILNGRNKNPHHCFGFETLSIKKPPFSAIYNLNLIFGLKKILHLVLK